MFKKNKSKSKGRSGWQLANLRLTVGRRLGLSFAAVVSFLVLIAVVGYAYTSLIEDKFTKLTDDTLEEIEMLGDISVSSVRFLSETREYLVFGEASTLEELKESTEKLDQVLGTLTAAGDELEGEDEAEIEAALVEDINTSWKAMQTSSAKLISLYEQGVDEDQLEQAGEALEEAEQSMSAGLEQLQGFLDEEIEEVTGEMRNTVRQAQMIMVFVPVGVVLFTIGLSYRLNRSIVVPIHDLTRTARDIEAGDLAQEVRVVRRDEIGDLASSFNAMTARLRESIQSLDRRGRQVTTSAEVSRRLSTILNRRELVIEVVEQVKEAFGYYHAHIYLYNDAKDELVMAGGTGDVGAAMLSEGHKIPKGRGLVGRAAESNAAVLVSDTSQDPDWLPNELLPETKAEVAIPISIGDQVLGVLDVQHDVTDGLGQEDVDALQSIANQVAVAMQNIAQYENTQKMAADLRVVANVGIAASTITDAGHLLQEVVDLSKQSFNLYHAHIYLLNESGDTLELASGAGAVGRKMVAEGRAIPLDSEQSLVARAARIREGVVVNDVQTDPDFLPNSLLPKTRAEMAVPMLVGGEVIGVLDVQSEQVNRFTDIDINIQTTLASQIAVTLKNARTSASAQKQAERETKLNLIAQKIQNSQTVEEALQVAVREVGRALETQASVRLKSDNGQEDR